MPPEEVDYSLMGAEAITMATTASINEQNMKIDRKGKGKKALGAN